MRDICLVFISIDSAEGTNVCASKMVYSSCVSNSMASVSNLYFQFDPGYFVCIPGYTTDSVFLISGIDI